MGAEARQAELICCNRAQERTRLNRTAPPRSVAQTWKLRFTRSTARMWTAVICLSFVSAATTPAEGGIYPISCKSAWKRGPLSAFKRLFHADTYPPVRLAMIGLRSDRGRVLPSSADVPARAADLRRKGQTEITQKVNLQTIRLYIYGPCSD